MRAVVLWNTHREQTMLGAPHHRLADLRIFVPGYTVLARAWDDARMIIFQGRGSESGAPVFIKTPKARPPPAEDLLALQRDYDIGASFQSSGILSARAHLRHGDTEYLVLPDDGLRPAGEILLIERPGIALCLEFAVRLAKILDGLHRAQITHKNLNPYSAWFDLRSLETKISDFSFALRSGEPMPAPQSLTQPQGDPRYIAPEQTGRIPRGTDPRTDLYSLGALLYHVVTGKPPFDGTEVLELLHAHLARLPLPPHALDHKIPEPFSKIIMKLLAKVPEERYQTARGLEIDLRECLTQWQWRTAGSATLSQVRTTPRRHSGCPGNSMGVSATLRRSERHWSGRGAAVPNWFWWKARREWGNRSW